MILVQPVQSDLPGGPGWLGKEKMGRGSHKRPKNEVSACENIKVEGSSDRGEGMLKLR